VQEKKGVARREEGGAGEEGGDKKKLHCASTASSTLTLPFQSSFSPRHNGIFCDTGLGTKHRPSPSSIQGSKAPLLLSPLLDVGQLTRGVADTNTAGLRSDAVAVGVEGGGGDGEEKGGHRRSEMEGGGWWMMDGEETTRTMGGAFMELRRGKRQNRKTRGGKGQASPNWTELGRVGLCELVSRWSRLKMRLHELMLLMSSMTGSSNQVVRLTLHAQCLASRGAWRCCRYSCTKQWKEEERISG
jgi:hypothetical protein